VTRGRCTCLAVLCAWLAAPAQAGAVPPDGGSSSAPAPRDGEAARSSETLLREALALAGSAEPADHARLLAQLRSKRFLARLDSEDDYRQASRAGLRLQRVLSALAGNPAASARKTLLALARHPGFLADEERRFALLRASEPVRPAPPRLVAFWDAHSRVGDMYTPTTVDILVGNGSEAALRLFERKLLDSARRQDEKIAWLRTTVLTHRNDLALLRACERMLRGKLPKPLRPFLIEALFDYRPGEWYRPASHHAAPPLGEASPEALAVLQSIGERALATVRLTPAQRQVVAQRLEAVKKLRRAEEAP